MSFSEKDIKSEYEKYRQEAEKILEDNDKVGKILDEAELKMSKVPVFGEDLRNVIVMIEMILSYIKKEYRDIPKCSIISMLAAITYFLSPIDLVPDCIPVLGYIDDVAVIKLVLSLGIKGDVQKYKEWRKCHEKNS